MTMKEELIKLGFVLGKIDEPNSRKVHSDFEVCFELDLPNGGCIVINSDDDTDNESIQITLKNDSGYEFIYQH